jgi:hypothetical protein
MDILYKPDALYHAYKTVRLEDKLGEDMPDQKRRIEDRHPTEPLQWDEQPATDWRPYHSALSQCAELLDNMKDGDSIFDVPKYLADYLASQSQAAQPSDDQLRETDGYKLGWMEGMQEGAELATGGEKTAADVEAEFADLLPGSYYMDPPDGGSPSVLEQVSRMAEDAAQWRAHLSGQSQAAKVQAVPVMTVTNTESSVFGCDWDAVAPGTYFVYAAPTAQEVTKQAAPEGWRERLQQELAAQQEHYGKVAAAASVDSRIFAGERDCTEGVIKGVEYCIAALEELEASHAAQEVTQQAAPDLHMIQLRLKQILNPARDQLSAQWMAADALYYLTKDDSFAEIADSLMTQQAAKPETAEQADWTVYAQLPDIHAKLREAYRRGAREQQQDAGEYKAAEEIMLAWDLLDTPTISTVSASDEIRNQAPEAPAQQVGAPVAWIATDLDGRAGVAFTKEEAKRQAGEGCTEFIPLFDLGDAAATTASASTLCKTCCGNGKLYDLEREATEACGDCNGTGRAPAPSQEAHAGADTEAARDVLAERRRQVESEGWTPEHDNAHATGEMAQAAAAYAMTADSRIQSDWIPGNWPWSTHWWRPTTIRRNLVKAGALILAEIERIDRAAIATSEQKGPQA